jgi:S-DNA-T family DNA segregation ATPase FtsK/SpoIIIE
LRLKLSLKQRGRPTRDLHVTVDVTATVGELASHLLRDDPERTDAREASPSDVTLRVEHPGVRDAQQLSPLLSVHESGLRSGCTIEIVQRADAGLVAENPRPVLGALQVVAGPDAGRRYAITQGVRVIGRDPVADVQLADSLVSRRHASVSAGATVVISDLNSANGIEIDGRQAARAVLTPRTRIRIGDDELRWVPDPASDRVRSPGLRPMESQPTSIPFTRSPRVEPVYRGKTFALPEPPGTVDRTRFPLLAMVAPLAMGAALFAATQQAMSLLFIALSPIIMVGTWLDNRIQNRRKKRDSQSRFAESLKDVRDALKAEHERERAVRVAESPSTGDVMEAIRVRSPTLWTRKPEHTTFLELRFGTGRLPTRNVITLPPRRDSASGDWDDLTGLSDEFAVLDGLPVIENLERAGAIGIAGSTILAADVARAVVIQLAGLHSPADLAIVAFGAEEVNEDWSWLKWLPHVESPHTPVKGGSLAADFGSANRLMSELEELIELRRAAGSGKGAAVRSRLDESEQLDAEHGSPVIGLPATPAVVAIVAATDSVDRARLVSIAERGPDSGLFLVWVAADAAALPVACRTFVEVDDSGRSTVGYVRTGRRIGLAAVEAVDVISAQEIARSLAPVADSGARVLDESDLPRRVALLDLVDDPVASDPDAVTRRWRKTGSIMRSWSHGSHRTPGGIRAVVGQSTDGPLHLDLRADGPHALVGGTTGSGKSEFLQSWILSLATEYSPDRVTFLLVDYKGGSAFADCVELPHTVGLVTDLTPRLVRRALTSLKAELRYREELLNRSGAKDLETLEGRSDTDAPPSLVIIIDEFAALAADVPEFVTGVIDVAQRGRSLGLHLVMATQRPAGVISDGLRANTNLRVALRVADDADSTDVVGVSVAAHFDPGTPGRAAAKLGPGRVLDFQSAFVGGWTDDGRAGSEIEIAELGFGRSAPWARSGALQTHTGATDSARLVSTINSAAKASAIGHPRRPWLDELPETIDVESLPPPSGARMAVGLIDEPESQRQRPFLVDPAADGTLAIIGTTGSGKSTLLRTIAFAASERADEAPVWIYGIDCAGGALRPLEQLPTVGSIIPADDDERLTRLIRMLGTVAEERAERFEAVGAASLDDFARLTGAVEPSILVLIDGMSALRTDFEFRPASSLFDDIVKLIGLGRQLGIGFVLTADRPAAIPTAVQANVQTTVVLRLAGESEYFAAGVAPDVLLDAPPGRGLVRDHEIQVGVPGGGRDVAVHGRRLSELARALNGRVRVAPPIARLPLLVRGDELPTTVDGRTVVGLGHETLSPVPVEPEGIFVVTGPLASGRTTAMRTIVRNTRAARPGTPFYLLSVSEGGLADELHWTASSSSPASACELAEKLAASFASLQNAGRAGPTIVIEDAGNFEGLPADAAVARLIGVARRAGAFVLAETDTATGSGAWAIHGQLKGARSGIVLQPDEGDGMSIFRLDFPRIRRSDFPVGRGILVSAGRHERVQVAYTEPSAG